MNGDLSPEGAAAGAVIGGIVVCLSVLYALMLGIIRGIRG